MYACTDGSGILYGFWSEIWYNKAKVTGSVAGPSWHHDPRMISGFATLCLGRQLSCHKSSYLFLSPRSLHPMPYAKVNSGEGLRYDGEKSNTERCLKLGGLSG